MYAVLNSGGKQYKVQQGEVLRVEKIFGDVGSPVTFDRVLMFADGDNVSIGRQWTSQPHVHPDVRTD